MTASDADQRDPITQRNAPKRTLKHAPKHAAATSLPTPPQWVLDAVTSDWRPVEGDANPLGDVAWTDIQGAGRLIRVSFSDVASRSAIRQNARSCYDHIRSVIADDPHLRPARLWNFIPRLQEEAASGINRYMAFNEGRQQAYADWFGSSRAAGPPTATGVDASADAAASDRLVVYALALPCPITHVENPRQRPAYEYSSRFGPSPPAFARATIATWQGRPSLFIGGTASVRGEDSLHAGDLHAQLNETRINLAAIVREAITRNDRTNPGDTGDISAVDQARYIARLNHVTIYVNHRDDLLELQSIAPAAFASTASLTFVLAPLCRSELMVEIEAIADIEPDPTPPARVTPRATSP